MSICLFFKFSRAACFSLSSFSLRASSSFLSLDFLRCRIGGVEARVGDFAFGFGGGPDRFRVGFYSFAIGFDAAALFYSSDLSVI